MGSGGGAAGYPATVCGSPSGNRCLAVRWRVVAVIAIQETTASRSASSSSCGGPRSPRAGGPARREQASGLRMRRSDVAAPAGVSVEYYAKLERGALAGVSAGVHDAVARALQRDDAG